MKEYIVRIVQEEEGIWSGLFTADDIEHAKEQALMLVAGKVIDVWRRIE